jgi:hypothetical protein
MTAPEGIGQPQRCRAALRYARPTGVKSPREGRIG